MVTCHEALLRKDRQLHKFQNIVNVCYGIVEVRGIASCKVQLALSMSTRCFIWPVLVDALTKLSDISIRTFFIKPEHF